MSAMAVAHASELLRIPVPPDQIVRSILLSTSLCVSPLPLTLLVFVLWVDQLILYLYVKENGPSHAFSLSVFLFFFLHGSGKRRCRGMELGIQMQDGYEGFSEWFLKLFFLMVGRCETLNVCLDFVCF